MFEVTLPPPKRFQRVVAKDVAWESFLNAAVPAAPPRLRSTFLPRFWQVVMFLASKGQSSRPVALMAWAPSVGSPLHAGPKLMDGRPAGP